MLGDSVNKAVKTKQNKKRERQINTKETLKSNDTIKSEKWYVRSCVGIEEG